MSLIMRSARLPDLPVLRSFEQGIVTAERPYDSTLKADPISYYDIEEMIRSEDAEVAVAEVDGEIVASGYVKKRQSREYVMSDDHAFIGLLYVAPPHRGQGVNKRVLGHLFAWAKTNNLPDVHLTVYPENAPAVRAYEKAGFEPYLLEMRLNLDEIAE